MGGLQQFINISKQEFSLWNALVSYCSNTILYMPPSRHSLLLQCLWLCWTEKFMLCVSLLSSQPLLLSRCLLWFYLDSFKFEVVFNFEQYGIPQWKFLVNTNKKTQVKLRPCYHSFFMYSEQLCHKLQVTTVCLWLCHIVGVLLVPLQHVPHGYVLGCDLSNVGLSGA